MRAINEANEPEIALAWDALALVLADQFLETAGVRGVSIWEKELKISPKDTDTLAGRKARIKAMWNRETPYTVPWLKKWLSDICGPDGHRETVRDHALDIWLDYAALRGSGVPAAEVVRMLRDILPADLWWRLTLTLEMRSALHIGGAMSVVARLPVPEAADELRFEETVRAGGRLGAIVTVPVPELRA